LRLIAKSAHSVELMVVVNTDTTPILRLNGVRQIISQITFRRLIGNRQPPRPPAQEARVNMPDSDRKYSMRKRRDGLYEVFMPRYRSVCIPESIGDKAHAKQHLASEYAMTVKEYEEYTNGSKRSKTCPRCGCVL